MDSRLIRIYISPWALSVVLLAGCAVKPPIETTADEREQAWQARVSELSAIDAWRLDGRVAINNAKDSWTANLTWRESEDNQEVRVVAPLGQGTAILKRIAGGLSELRLSSGETFVGESASELLHQQLGWYLPVESLSYWIKGMPDPSYVSLRKLNDQGAIAQLEQAGWKVEYKGYEFSRLYSIDLPEKLYLKRDDWRVKLVVQNWQDY